MPIELLSVGDPPCYMAVAAIVKVTLTIVLEMMHLVLPCSDKQEDKQRQLLRTVSDSPARPVQPVRRPEDSHLPTSTGQLETSAAGMV